jgi:hypothetical protein
MAKKTTKKTTKRMSKKTGRRVSAPAEKRPRSAAAADRDARTAASLQKLADSGRHPHPQQRQHPLEQGPRHPADGPRRPGPPALQPRPGQEVHADHDPRRQRQVLIEAGQDPQPPRHVLQVPAHHRGHQGKDLRRPERVRRHPRGPRGLRSARSAKSCTSSPRSAARWSATSPIIDSGDEIDCRRMGIRRLRHPLASSSPTSSSSRSATPSSSCTSRRTPSGQRFNEDKFWQKHNCILTEGGGQPPRGVRRLLHRLNQELGLPIYCLLDCDPWGHYIYSVIKQGSISLAFESERLAIPRPKFLGIRAADYEQHDLTDDVKIELGERDITRAKQIATTPGSRTRSGSARSTACSATASRWKSKA